MKVKLFLFVIRHQATMDSVGVKVYLYIFLTSVLDGGKWSASCTQCCIHELELGGWAEPRTNLDTLIMNCQLRGT